MNDLPLRSRGHCARCQQGGGIGAAARFTASVLQQYTSPLPCFTFMRGVRAPGLSCRSLSNSILATYRVRLFFVAIFALCVASLALMRWISTVGRLRLFSDLPDVAPPTLFA